MHPTEPLGVQQALERRLIREEPVPYAVARALLARRVKASDVVPIGDITEKAWVYLGRFGKGDENLALQALLKLVDQGLSELAAANVLSICPRTRGELRSILEVERSIGREPLPPTETEKLDAILAAIEDFCKTAGMD